MTIEGFLKNKAIEDNVPRFKKDYLMYMWPIVGKTFVQDYAFDELAERMINFFCKEREDFYPELIKSPKKGMLVHGSVGQGKTLNFLIYKRILFMCNETLKTRVSEKNCNPKYASHNFFHIEEVAKFELRYRQNGIKSVDNLIFKNELVIDDIGSENPKIIDYGNEIDIVSNILLLRYTKMQDGFYVTHATSNLAVTSTENQFSKRYGDRITDRMNEMFLFILAKGESKRK